jgi:hypothetical protein
MQEYPVKRGFAKDLKASVVSTLHECFGVEPEYRDDHYRIRYGALAYLDVAIGTKGKSIIIETESDKSSADEVILDTNRRFRKFLDMVTGYTTKDRVKLAKTVE